MGTCSFLNRDRPIFSHFTISFYTLIRSTVTFRYHKMSEKRVKSTTDYCMNLEISHCILYYKCYKNSTSSALIACQTLFQSL